MNEEEYEINMIEMVKNTQTIYQYMSSSGGRSMLTESTLMLKNPSEFNDPYDCYTGLISPGNIPLTFRENAIKRWLPSLNRKKIREKLRAGKKINDKQVAKIFKDKVLPYEISIRGISCFSRSNDNMLMWSHYCQSHTGICIGFNLNNLYYFVRGIAAINGWKPMMLPVSYKEEFIPVEYFDNKTHAIYTWLSTKYDLWKYEQEIRLIMTDVKFNETRWKDKKIKTFKIDPDLIEEVYLGSKIDHKDEEVILNLCARMYPKAKVYKMHLIENSFRLQPEIIRN